MGNLTLSGYNSKLSNASFIEKKDLHNNKKFLGFSINIGYKNRLPLNDLRFQYNGSLTNLAEIMEWNVEVIKSRNKKMVDILLKLFAFEEAEHREIENAMEVE